MRIESSHAGGGRQRSFRELAELSSTEEIALAVRALADGYGQVVGVTVLTPETGANRTNCHLIVQFERGEDAVRAARDWRCRLFGFTCVIVSITPTVVTQGVRP